MSAKAEKRARRMAKGYGYRFDDAFARQVPRWLKIVQAIFPMHDMARIFRPALERWQRKMAAPRQRYKRVALKQLARVAKEKLREARA